jgi:hypothetical protein
MERRPLPDNRSKVGFTHFCEPVRVQVPQPVAQPCRDPPCNLGPDSLIGDDADEKFKGAV